MPVQQLITSNVETDETNFDLFGGKVAVATKLVQAIENQHLIENGSTSDPFNAITKLGRWEFMDALSSRRLDFERILPPTKPTTLPASALHEIRLQLIDALSPPLSS